MTSHPPIVVEGPPRPLGAIWGNERVPVLLRPKKQPPLYIRLPFDPGNRAWLQESGSHHPKWVSRKRHWTVPMAWFNPLIKRCINRYRAVYVIQPLNRTEVCAPACWNAEKDLCECSCMGANHGSGHPGGNWKEVSEAFAVRWEGGELACRLLVQPR
jgi:hypothetical protein